MKGGGDWDGLRALLRLGAGEDQAAAFPFGAGARVFGAVRWAGLGAPALVVLVPRAVRRAGVEVVKAFAARVGVQAAVAPSEPELPLGVEEPVVEIDVWPAESQGLAGAKARADADDPAHEGGAFGGGFQERLGFLDRERVRFCLIDCGRVDEGGDVLGDDPAAVSDFQGAGENAVNLEYVGRSVPGIEHLPVHPFQVFGGELVEAVLSDAGTMSLRVLDQ